MTEPASLDDFDTAEGGLAFWHPVNDEPVDESFLPWGDIAPGTSDDKTVRLRNTSETYTARGVSVGIAGPPDAGDPSCAEQHLLSVDGYTFAATIELGDLPPGATGEPFTLRRITPRDAVEGPSLLLIAAFTEAWEPAGAAATPAGSAAGDGFDADAAEAPVDDAEAQMGEETP